MDENNADELGGMRVSSETGPQAGLSLVLNVEQPDYMDGGFTQTTGARVTINGGNQKPMPDQLGMDVQPNTANNFAIKLENYTSMPAPYDSNCSSDWSSSTYAPFLSNDGWPYDLNRCKRYCLQWITLNTCNCVHPLYIENDSDRFNKLPCNLTAGASDATCIAGVISQLDNSASSCDCSVECLASKYQTLISSTQWPSLQYTDDATTLYFNGFPSGRGGLTNTQLTTMDLLKINVFFTSLDATCVTETPCLSWDDGSMMGAIGAVMALFLGLTFIMLVELLELLIDFILNTLRWMHGKPIGRKYLP